ncbi:MAG: hypothetical protein ABII00_06825 [Elusimicrobiota bacterium]
MMKRGGWALTVILALAFFACQKRGAVDSGVAAPAPEGEGAAGEDAEGRVQAEEWLER